MAPVARRGRPVNLRRLTFGEGVGARLLKLALVKLVQEILTDELCNNGAPPGVGWFDRAEKLIAALAGAK